MEVETKLATSRKEQRKQSKKRKLLALAQMAKMNDKDRMAKQASVGPDEKRTKVDDSDAKSMSIASNTTDDTTSPIETKIDDTNANSAIKTTNTGTKLNPWTSTSTVTSKSTSAAIFQPSSPTESPPKQVLSDSDYRDLSLQLNARRQQLKQLPMLQLCSYGERASLEVPPEKRVPLFLNDIQHLLMSTVIGSNSPCSPSRWCTMDSTKSVSHSVVLVLEGLSLYHYLSNETKFEQTNKIFDTRLELVVPPSKMQGMIMEQLAQVPLTNVQAKQLIEQYGSLKTAIEMTKDPTLLVKNIFPIDDAVAREGGDCNQEESNSLPESDKFPRTKLLLSALQMVEEGYPMPLRGELSERYKNYVFSKPKYAPVTHFSPMYGLDCEMCRTTSGTNELTRISIVNEKLETVYETLVMPDNRIVNYLTQFSGITPEIMKSVTKRLPDVQKEVQQLLPSDAILIGQSLNSDLTALQMMHPYVIDTSVCFNISGVRRRKAKLQALAMTFLKESIQVNEYGHDSVEDSVASLKLVQMKLAHSIEFGDAILTAQRRVQETVKVMCSDSIYNNLIAHASAQNKRTAIIHAGVGGAVQPQVKQIIEKAHEALPNGEKEHYVKLYEYESSNKAVKKAQQIATENSLTITNLQLTDRPLHMPDEAERTAAKIDKWINQLWSGVADNGMFVVLMGGNEECKSGLAKIAFKKDSDDRRLCQIRWPNIADASPNGH